jgi:hypothetical protein
VSRDPVSQPSQPGCSGQQAGEHAGPTRPLQHAGPPRALLAVMARPETWLAHVRACPCALLPAEHPDAAALDELGRRRSLFTSQLESALEAGTGTDACDGVRCPRCARLARGAARCAGLAARGKGASPLPPRSWVAALLAGAAHSLAQGSSGTEAVARPPAPLPAFFPSGGHLLPCTGGPHPCRPHPSLQLAALPRRCAGAGWVRAIRRRGRPSVAPL